MGKLIKLDIERVTRRADESIIVEQAVAFNSGLALLSLMQRGGRPALLVRLRSIWESYPADTFEHVLGWIFFLRLRLWEIRLAKAATKIPGIYELFGRSPITHWFQSLSLREIDLVDDPVAAFGASVDELEERGIRMFREHLQRWRQTRIKGAA